MKNVKLLSNEELIKRLEEASSAFYNTDTLVMSNDEFDEYELEYQRRFNKKYVGAAPLSTKGTINVDHSYSTLVGTLSKCKNIEDVKEWLVDVVNKLGGNLPTIFITLKYDGNSIVIEYVNGKVDKVLTRGKDGKGLDLTHIFKNYHELEYITQDCGIKYEVIMKYEHFYRLDEEYANPRSVVAGKLGSDNAIDYLDHLTLVPLWMKNKGNKEMDKPTQFINLSKEFGQDFKEDVKDYSYTINTKTVDEMISDIEEVYNEIISIRDNLPFMIDGLVLEVLETNYRDKLGMNTDYPNWATALKFPYMEKQSKVVRFDYCLGDSARITPRVWFEPVEFNGTIHTKQSLQNYARYNELDLRIGSDIIVSYSNDCLTYIEVLETENTKNLRSLPKDNIVCPVCGSKAEPNETGAFLYCRNNNCEGQIVGKIQNYLTKMDIKGIKINMIEAFKEAGLVNGIKDLYTMDYDKLSDIPRMGSKVANNVKTAINTKVYYDYEILGSLGIENCSRTTSKEICKSIRLVDLLHDVYEDKFTETMSALTSLDNIAEITAENVYNGLTDNMELVSFLMERPYKIYKDELESMKNDNDEEPLTIVFTGFRNKELKDELELQGHKITSGVSKKTDLVVTPEPSGKSAKLDKARELNIPIISLADFLAEVME